jgi:hypothetical protein
VLWVAGIFDPTAFYSWPTPTTQTTRFRSLCLTFLIVFLSVLVWCDLLAGNSNQRGKKQKTNLSWPGRVFYHRATRMHINWWNISVYAFFLSFSLSFYSSPLMWFND